MACVSRESRKLTIVFDFTSLLKEKGNSWGGNGTNGRPVFLTYSFELSAPEYLEDDPAFLASFQPLTQSHEALAREALDLWQAETGIQFLEVPADQGDIRFGLYNLDLYQEYSGFRGFAYNPYVMITEDYAVRELPGGDVFADLNFTPSLDFYLHEIGHALGLKHPFDDDPVLPPNLDNKTNTIMSYTGGTQNQLGPFDVQAAQYLYGHQAGANLVHWEWDPEALTLQQIDGDDGDTLIGLSVKDDMKGMGGDDALAGFGGDDQLDGGAGNDLLFGGSGDDLLIGGAGADRLHGGHGNDNASYATASAGVHVQLSFEGGTAGDAEGDSFWDIENLTGSSFDDILFGNDANNELFGGDGDDFLDGAGGDDSLDGGVGTDTVFFFGNHAEFIVNKLNGVVQVSGNGANENSTDTLANIELYEFEDGIFSLSDLIAPSDTENGVYRFFNAANGTHFYSASEDERDSVINDLDTFLYEGAAYRSAPLGAQDSHSVWRFFNEDTGVHFYTISESERDSVIDSLPKFVFEGPAYEANDVQVEGSTGLHRFFNTETGTHFYTASDAEQENVELNLPEFTYEGIAFYVDVI